MERNFNNKFAKDNNVNNNNNVRYNEVMTAESNFEAIPGTPEPKKSFKEKYLTEKNVMIGMGTAIAVSATVAGACYRSSKKSSLKYKGWKILNELVSIASSEKDDKNKTAILKMAKGLKKDLEEFETRGKWEELSDPFFKSLKKKIKETLTSVKPFIPEESMKTLENIMKK